VKKKAQEGEEKKEKRKKKRKKEKKRKKGKICNVEIFKKKVIYEVGKKYFCTRKE
jgi:hypothetical protein